MTDSAPDFTWLPDLALRTAGGAVVWANDDSFAEKENLIKPGPAKYQPATFGHRGQVYDGWETRRRREAGFDEAIVRLGVPGVIRGVVIDTAWFKGNFPPEASLDALEVDGYPTAEELAAEPGWVSLVERAKIYGDSRNPFEVSSGPAVDPRAVTHLPRRRRGTAARPWRGQARPTIPRRRPGRPGRTGERRAGAGLLEPVLQLAAEPDLPRTGPGHGRRLGDRAPTRRRQRLGAYPAGRARPDRLAEIDTSYFIGNSPAAASLKGLDSHGEWVELLPRTDLLPDTRHRFLVDTDATRFRGPTGHLPRRRAGPAADVRRVCA